MTGVVVGDRQLVSQFLNEIKIIQSTIFQILKLPVTKRDYLVYLTAFRLQVGRLIIKRCFNNHRHHLHTHIRQV